MDFDWSQRPVREWRAFLARAPQVTLLQSWPYARAVRAQNQLMTRTAVVRQHGAPRGVFQIQEVTLGPLHVVHLHRGPLWLDDAPSRDEWADFLKLFDETFPARLGRWRRIMPSLPHTDETEALMTALGYRAKGDPYQTIWVDLTPDLAVLRRGLKQKWRNALNKAERSRLAIEHDTKGRLGDWFTGVYGTDKARRGYRGASPRFLSRLIQEAALFDDVWILRALKQGEPIAGIVLFLHGRSATYQAGWTNAEGRAANAHHLLLWQAIAALKNQGTTAFDLGGVHPAMAEGVTRFKQGLNGEHCILCGLYA